jgi:hypothetical protein
VAPSRTLKSALKSPAPPHSGRQLRPRDTARLDATEPAVDLDASVSLDKTLPSVRLSAGVYPPVLSRFVRTLASPMLYASISVSGCLAAVRVLLPPDHSIGYLAGAFAPFG